MKITKSLGAFFLAFLIGGLPVWLAKSFYSPENESEKKSEAAPISQISPSKEQQPEPRVFNVEGFWDDSENQYNKRLLETGEISNGKDIKAKSGEKWLGLFNKNGREFLRSTRIKISAANDGDLDWTEISVKEQTNPLFLLKKSKHLKEGEIRTLFREKTPQETEESIEAAAIKDGFLKKFTLGEKEYTLRAEKGLSEKQEPILVLLLETENTSQLIHYIYFMDAGYYVGNLYWVGDLDGDGKLDLFMDFYGYEKGGYSSGLFLSSEAEKGKLVKKIEYFGLSGC